MVEQDPLSKLPLSPILGSLLQSRLSIETVFDDILGLSRASVRQGLT